MTNDTPHAPQSDSKTHEITLSLTSTQNPFTTLANRLLSDDRIEVRRDTIEDALHEAAIELQSRPDRINGYQEGDP